MKLLLCAKCNEVFNLGHSYKECSGNHGGGEYTDEVNAKIWGDKDRIFLLGFANSSIVSALRSQIKDGDSDETFYYAGEFTPKGREFTAFVIPNAASSVTRYADKTAYDGHQVK